MEKKIRYFYFIVSRETILIFMFVQIHKVNALKCILRPNIKIFFSNIIQFIDLVNEKIVEIFICNNYRCVRLLCFKILRHLLKNI